MYSTWFALLLILYPPSVYLGVIVVSSTNSDILFSESMKLAGEIACSVHTIYNYSDDGLPQQFQGNSHETNFESNLKPISVHTVFLKSASQEKRLEFPFQLKLQEPMSLDESLYLLYLNLAHALQKGYNVLPVFPEIAWKRHAIDIMAKIVTKVCPSGFVPINYIHMVKELFLHYQSHLYNQLEIGRERSDVKNQISSWVKIQIVLQRCFANAEGMNLIDNSGVIIGMRLKDDSSENNILKINPPDEDADLGEKLRAKDDIIEGGWWIFSLVYGYCFSHFGNNNGETVSNPSPKQFLTLFQSDFLGNIVKRWMEAGKLSKSFGTIFGNFNNSLIKRNLRYCVTAAYMKNSIEDSQLARPFF